MKKKYLIVGAIFLVLGMLLILGTFIGEWYWTRSQGQKELAKAEAALDQFDPHWRAEELYERRNASLPPPERNGATRALEAVALTPKSFDEWMNESSKLREVEPEIGVLYDDDEMCEEAYAWNEAAEAIAVARTVKQFTTGGIPIVLNKANPLGTLLDKTQKMRTSASLLRTDARVLAYANDGNGALAAAHATINAARSMGDEPTLISQLVRMAITAVAIRSIEQSLGWTEADQGLAELQQIMIDEIPVNRLKFGLRGDRGGFHLLFENLNDGTLDVQDLGTGKSNLGERMMSRYYRKYIPAQQAKLLTLFDQLLQASELTGPEQTAALAAIQMPPPSYSNILIRLLFPAWEKLFAAEARTKATLGATAVALACERYRLKFGHWPESLDAIPKSILPKVPLDPYRGGPLSYRITDTGVVIYATGPDLTDDDGETLDPKGTNGTDVGFRLIHPELRRQPALPKPIIEDDLIELPEGAIPGEVPPVNVP